MWYRVFCRDGSTISPADLVLHLHGLGLAVTPHFRGDELGWTGGELRTAAGAPILLERWLTAEDDVRDDLNAHAAELETLTYSPHAPALMERVIQTQQLITLRKPIDSPDEITHEAILGACCQYLATRGDGVYQIDGRGWHRADGEVIIAEY
jgi:hypothetical protein